MLKAAWSKYLLNFKQPATTSRETMTVRPTYFIKIWDDDDPTRFGIGEAALFKGLSADDLPDYESVMEQCCRRMDDIARNLPPELDRYPSILFGLETAVADLKYSGKGIITDCRWTDGREPILINGLVWMGNYDEMLQRVEQKLSEGFHCLKFKIGGIDFAQEAEMIRQVRKSFSKDLIEIRLDANGGFSPADAMTKLEQLAQFDIHSIEQPIRQGQWAEIAKICRESPIPVALDEELIGVAPDSREKLVETIMPAYLILKPTLCGGMRGSDHWIRIAENHGVGWWATSALESNIGLNAIGQWISCKPTEMVQGLGTGALYMNNIPSPIEQIGESLFYNADNQWDYSNIKWMDAN